MTNKPWQYPPPLDRLFTFGDAEFGTQKEMPDYVGQLGLTREHVPALVEIVRLWEDEDGLPEGVAGSAPIHAWRALGQLRAIEAVEPLLAMQNRLAEERDDWLVVNQFAVVEGQSHRRADIVVFINGLPLGVIELKNAADEDATIWDAWQQLQTYKQEIPSLFHYNAAMVISDGLQARIAA